MILPAQVGSDSAGNADKPIRATVPAKPFPGAVAQGGALVFAREMNELSFGRSQMSTKIGGLGFRGERFETFFEFRDGRGCANRA